MKNCADLEKTPDEILGLPGDVGEQRVVECEVTLHINTLLVYVTTGGQRHTHRHTHTPPHLQTQAHTQTGNCTHILHPQTQIHTQTHTQPYTHTHTEAHLEDLVLERLLVVPVF